MRRTICIHCGDVIGVYEPAVVIDDQARRTTSLAREPELDDGTRRLAHAACAGAHRGEGTGTDLPGGAARRAA